MNKLDKTKIQKALLFYIAQLDICGTRYLRFKCLPQFKIQQGNFSWVTPSELQKLKFWKKSPLNRCKYRTRDTVKVLKNHSLGQSKKLFNKTLFLEQLELGPWSTFTDTELFMWRSLSCLISFHHMEILWNFGVTFLNTFGRHKHSVSFYTELLL